MQLPCAHPPPPPSSALWARAGDAGHSHVLLWLLGRAARLTDGDATIVVLSGIGDDDAAHLAAALMADATVTSLSLRGGQLGDEGVARLAEALKVNTTMTTLDLTGNLFSAVGTSHLAEALAANTTLTKLDIGSNLIGNVGIGHLAEALRSNTTLAFLGVGYSGIGAVGAQVLDALSVGSLDALDLQLNHLTLDSDRATLDLLRQAWGDRPGLYL